jgi:hypothetical protein
MTSVRLVNFWETGGLGMDTGALFILKLLDRHRVQGSDPTHPVLAQFYDFLGNVTRRWVVYDLQAQGLTHALQRE